MVKNADFYRINICIFVGCRRGFIRDAYRAGSSGLIRDSVRVANRRCQVREGSGRVKSGQGLGALG